MVRNPFNYHLVNEIYFEDVDLIVFCSKNPLPIIDRIKEIDKPILFHITITPYNKDVEPNVIDKKDSIMVILASITAGADIMVAADYRSRNKNEIKKAKENGLNAKEFKLKNKDDLMFALFDTDYYNETRGVPLLQRLGEEKKSEKKNRRK